MNGRKFRSGLFGFKKTDVYNYICEMDEKAEMRLREKDEEIARLKERLDELQKNRDAIVNVLQTAEKNAQDIVSRAHKDAEEMIQTTEREVRKQKGMVNREIEIKRRAVKNYYAAENKKIARIKDEVERMREASIAAIKRFEAELSEVERMADNSAGRAESVMEYADSAAPPKLFDVERTIPIQVVGAEKQLRKEA